MDKVILCLLNVITTFLKTALARIYFSVTGKSIDKEGGAQKKREIFPVPHTGNGSKDSNFKNI
jgi:hypothetical protein